MLFRDRTDAGQKLADKLSAYANRTDVVVLGIPRGGVVVASQVAACLHAPLDVFLLRKLGVPGFEELAFGAIASGGAIVLDRETIDASGLSERDIEQVLSEEQKELTRREQIYRGDQPPLGVQGKTVIVVDDGIATGSSMRAGVQGLRRLQPSRIVVGVPVVPPRTCALLNGEVDELVCLKSPALFLAIGQFYEDFSQVSDEEVQAVLKRTAEAALKKAG